jgi:hypothetical protein
MSEQNGEQLKISVVKNGPYVVEGVPEIKDARGEDASKDGKVFLCRC